MLEGKASSFEHPEIERVFKDFIFPMLLGRYLSLLQRFIPQKLSLERLSIDSGSLRMAVEFKLRCSKLHGMSCRTTSSLRNLMDDGTLTSLEQPSRFKLCRFGADERFGKLVR
ncbi:unnamed protein product [Linum tenue]|uniref:Uncharacterized protein n=1 Tax=Linum tenue TaxID=586396 RepID=A0AAV0RFB0_9ROSI|nr:unnamed protein product [Linum tenue]